jgi:hypothetical protein
VFPLFTMACASGNLSTGRGFSRWRGRLLYEQAPGYDPRVGAAVKEVGGGCKFRRGIKLNRAKLRLAASRMLATPGPIKPMTALLTVPRKVSE